MHFTIPALCLLLSQVLPASATPVDIEKRAVPTQYPTILTDTSFAGSVFQTIVKSSNPSLDRKNIQRIPGAGTDGADCVGVRNANGPYPVLSIIMRKGMFYGQTVDFSDNHKNDGTLGGLVNLQTINGTTQQSFIFRQNNADAPAQFKQTVKGWQLFSFNEAGLYGVYRQEPVGVTNGFIACPIGTGAAKYWEIRYYITRNEDGGLSGTKGCEFIGLETTIAPRINSAGVFFR